jgi:hypothetical protein
MDDDDDLVFELGDDDFHTDDAFPGRLPGPPLRERLRALKPTRAMLPTRSTARLTGVVLLVVAIGAGTSAAATAWADAAAQRQRDANVVKLALNALTDGDLATASADTLEGTATEDYLLEFANNGPVPVTVQAVKVTSQNDAASGHSTGWSPLTSKTVSPGGIGRIAVHMALTCNVSDVASSDQSLLNSLNTITTSAPSTPTVTVTTPNGRPHDVTLQPPPGHPQSSNVFASFGYEPAPEAVSVQNLACQPLDPSYSDVAHPQLPQAQPPGVIGPPAPLSLHYDGVDTAATSKAQDAVMKFTFTNTSKSVAADIAEVSDPTGMLSLITLQPTTVHLAPGASQQVKLTFGGICEQGYQYQMMSGLRLTVAAGGQITEHPVESLVDSPLLGLSVALAAEQTAYCS